MEFMGFGIIILYRSLYRSKPESPGAEVGVEEL